MAGSDLYDQNQSAADWIWEITSISFIIIVCFEINLEKNDTHTQKKKKLLKNHAEDGYAPAGYSPDALMADTEGGRKSRYNSSSGHF